MNGVAKGMLFVLLILYVLSPVDLCPGPIDDVIMMLVYFASSKASSAIEN